MTRQALWLARKDSLVRAADVVPSICNDGHCNPKAFLVNGERKAGEGEEAAAQQGLHRGVLAPIQAFKSNLSRRSC